MAGRKTKKTGEFHVGDALVLVSSPATIPVSENKRLRVLCEKWIVQNRCDIERFSSVLPERSSANPWFWALSCLPESQL
jgi:hypothetical protein